MRVLDVSPMGLGVECSDSASLPPGTVLEEVRLLQQGMVVANERAVVVNLCKGSPRRLGLQLVSGLFDLEGLQVRDVASMGMFCHLLAERELLPAPWRAAVADLAQLLKRTQDFFEGLERSLGGSPTSGHENRLFSELFLTWGAEYHAQLRHLHRLSAGFSPEARQAALDYAGHLLLPLVHCGPIHRRAYDKPQGYAGDFELMRLFFTGTMEGDTLYARFLHYAGQRYPTAQTVVSREKTMREALRARIQQGEGPLRILSLACGPALELQNLLAELSQVDREIELCLLDQDEDALAHAHQAVRQLLAQRGPALAQVRLNALHFSVMQLIRPRSEAEVAVARQVLSGMDFIYSAGLLDYLPRPIARRLISRLYGMLAADGELFIGNLREDPASAWMMEHATAWHLIYREPDQMRALAEGLSPRPARTDVVLDDTGRCMFLRVHRTRAG